MEAEVEVDADKVCIDALPIERVDGTVDMRDTGRVDGALPDALLDGDADRACAEAVAEAPVVGRESCATGIDGGRSDLGVGACETHTVTNEHNTP